RVARRRTEVHRAGDGRQPGAPQAHRERGRAAAPCLERRAEPCDRLAAGEVHGLALRARRRKLEVARPGRRRRHGTERPREQPGRHVEPLDDERAVAVDERRPRHRAQFADVPQVHLVQRRAALVRQAEG
ncbi:MAG: hypothetical protein ACK559_04510, partial [bacterium]